MITSQIYLWDIYLLEITLKSIHMGIYCYTWGISLSLVSILSEIPLEKAVFCFCKQRQLDISFLVRDRYPSLLSPFSTRNISCWNLCRPCACGPCEFSGHSVVSQACCIWRTLIPCCRPSLILTVLLFFCLDPWTLRRGLWWRVPI